MNNRPNELDQALDELFELIARLIARAHLAQSRQGDSEANDTDGSDHKDRKEK